MTLAELRKTIRSKARPSRAEHSMRFFKTAKGQYGAGDKFLGLTVPETRSIAREGFGLPLADVAKLLRSEWHEDRLCALFILVRQFEKGDAAEREKIYRLYLKSTRWVNNWDLVDSSAHLIVGRHHEGRSPALLQKCQALSRSRLLWDRRIAIVATQWQIRQKEVGPAFVIAELLLKDKEDLMHKAVGWTLREAGKRDLEKLRAFLRKHAKTMPRTALRYSIERMGPAERKRWMAR